MYAESLPLSGDHLEHDVDGPDMDADRAHWMSGASRRPSDFTRNRLASTRPSATRRLYRALVRFSIAVLIGVGGTLAWQYYGGATVRAWVPSLGWLLPADAPGPAVTSPELQTQLKPVALDLAIVRRSVEQLATKEEQLAQGLALAAVDRITKGAVSLRTSRHDVQGAYDSTRRKGVSAKRGLDA